MTRGLGQEFKPETFNGELRWLVSFAKFSVGLQGKVRQETAFIVS